MVNPRKMRSEMDVLEEKIATFRDLVDDKRREGGDIDHFLTRKLAEYTARYQKLSHDYDELFGGQDAGGAAARRAAAS
jgi:hypothetical protein